MTVLSATGTEPSGGRVARDGTVNRSERLHKRLSAARPREGGERRSARPSGLAHTGDLAPTHLLTTNPCRGVFGNGLAGSDAAHVVRRRTDPCATRVIERHINPVATGAA